MGAYVTGRTDGALTVPQEDEEYAERMRQAARKEDERRWAEAAAHREAAAQQEKAAAAVSVDDSNEDDDEEDVLFHKQDTGAPPLPAAIVRRPVSASVSQHQQQGLTQLAVPHSSSSDQAPQSTATRPSSGSSKRLLPRCGSRGRRASSLPLARNAVSMCCRRFRPRRRL